MLDDINVLKQRDPDGVLTRLADVAKTVTWQPKVVNPENDNRQITSVIVAGMGGSALAADLIRPLMAELLDISYEIVRDYDLPQYAGHNSLVIIISHSGNTEETLSCYRQARQIGCQIAVITSGGKLLELADIDDVVYSAVATGSQPRMSVFLHLKSLLLLLNHFDVINNQLFDEVNQSYSLLAAETDNWHHEVPVHANYAKQLALMSVGKTAIIYGGSLTAPVAYKWKISWNENAKNTAFRGTYPEFNHNEFIGWSSHPVEKPFVVFDIRSSFESPRILERMQLSDKLLSGKRPKTTVINLVGDTAIAQMLWGCMLADFVSTYVAVLNGVNPEPVALVERFKQELS